MMCKALKFITIGIVTSTLVGGLHSCMVNSVITEAPLLEQKHEAAVSASVQLPVPAASVSAVFAPTSHIALYSRAGVDVESQMMLQQSIGYYNKWNSRTTSAVYVGYARGNAHENFIQSPKDSGMYQALFSEFHLGVISKKSEHVRFGFTIKNGFAWSDLNRTYSSDIKSQPDSVGYTKGKAVILAPGGFIQFGNSPLRFTLFAQVFGIYDFTTIGGLSAPPFSMGVCMQYRYKPRYIEPPKVIQSNKRHAEPLYFTHDVEYPWMYTLAAGVGLTHSYVYSGTYMTAHSHTDISSTPVISFSADYLVRPWYSFGLQGGYMMSKGSLYDVPYEKQVTQQTTDIHFMYREFYVGLRPLFHILHFNHVLFYTGLHFGVQYNTMMLSDIPEEITEINITNSHIGYVPYLQYIPFGVRWFIKPHIGIMTEIGLVKPFVLHGGIVVRM